MRRVAILVVQATPYCNLDCDYCYLPNRGATRRITVQTLNRLFKGLAANSLLGSELTVLWRNGEPLTLPIDFYSAAFDEIQAATPETCRVTHDIQTNGVLLDDDWCRFLNARGVQLGISIDGPDFIHDLHRQTKKGRNSHYLVMRGIEALRRNNIPINVIAVVTQDSLPYPDEIFEFFKALGVESIGFNVEEVEGIHQRSSVSEAAYDQFYDFMQRLYLLQKTTSGHLRIREFDSAVNLIVNRFPEYGQQPKKTFNSQCTPMSYLSVDSDGNYATFSPELLTQKSTTYSNFILGNVWSNGFSRVFENKKLRRIYSDIREGVESCRQSCQYFGACGGGAPSNKYSEAGTFKVAETTYCKLAVQVPFEIVLRDLEHQALLGCKKHQS